MSHDMPTIEEMILATMLALIFTLLVWDVVLA
jgi:hypothetical protein